ncbi:hypothetical protein PMAA_021340 [Talaromyces marneffei ATCC 18224]|uniref:Uncharacterized protein n=2 Tax=Talaromyces marneffei TaxID=37727 RepID=B6Q4I7_TALMQ|nr:hypothetical protein PMAA_021340 [Talaromyces marneffei ATCC 18224]
MSATLRFPFQASLDGSAVVETDGSLYYGLDISHGFAELPAEGYPTLNSESEMQLGLGLYLERDDYEEEQEEPHSSSKIVRHPQRWDSLVKSKDQEQKQEPEEVTPRPISVSMHPHRINTSDQQRFATEHEMAAAEELEEENTICESPLSSTLDEAEATIRVSVPSSSVQQFIPSRYYATPLIKDDPTSTPVALYGLEKPSDYVPRKKGPAGSRQRGNTTVAAQSASRHQHQPSPLSSTVNPENRVEAAPRASTPSMRTLSIFLGRTSTLNTVYPTAVSRPTIRSISSSGSSATTSTVRSVGSAVSDVSVATSISTSIFVPSPTMVEANQKPTSDPGTTTTTLDHNQNPTSPFSRPQPVRRTTAPISNFTTDHIPVVGGDTRRNSISNFSSPMIHHRAGIKSSDNLTTIRAISDNQVTIPATNNYVFHDPSLEDYSSSSSKQMPFSPDSFISPHTHAYDSDSNEYNNSNSFSQINRPHTSHHDQRSFPKTPNPHYQAYTRNDKSQSQLRKPKKSGHQRRATKLFTRIFISDLNHQKA